MPILATGELPCSPRAGFVGLYQVLFGFIRVLFGFIRFYHVISGFIMLYHVLSCYIMFWHLSAFTRGYNWVPVPACHDSQHDLLPDSRGIINTIQYFLNLIPVVRGRGWLFPLPDAFDEMRNLGFKRIPFLYHRF